jgi:CheY-like chemotaxis protein
MACTSFLGTRPAKYPRGWIGWWIASIRKLGEQGGHKWKGHYRFRRQDGSYASVVDRGFIMADAAGKPTRVVGGISDVTEQQRAEQTLANSRRQLRGLSARLQSVREDERARVAREIHDELGQVLTALKINLDWLERKLGMRDNDPSLNPLLDRVVESAEIAESAIGSVQRIAAELRPSTLDNLGLTSTLEQEAGRFQQRTGIVCKVSLPKEGLELPKDGATAVFRIFQESLTNVARHAQATEVRAQLQAEEAQVVLKLEDNGRGIAPEAPFRDRRKLRVLLVDDHLMVRRSIRRLLKAAMPELHVVGEAADGLEALALMRTLTPDLVFMDISMPVLDGIEATRRITADFPGVRVIIVSANDDEGFHRRAREAGAAGYLLKGGSLGSFETDIRKILRRD